MQLNDRDQYLGTVIEKAFVIQLFANGTDINVQKKYGFCRVRNLLITRLLIDWLIFLELSVLPPVIFLRRSRLDSRFRQSPGPWIKIHTYGLIVVFVWDRGTRCDLARTTTPDYERRISLGLLTANSPRPVLLAMNFFVSSSRHKPAVGWILGWDGEGEEGLRDAVRKCKRFVEHNRLSEGSLTRFHNPWSQWRKNGYSSVYYRSMTLQR